MAKQLNLTGIASNVQLGKGGTRIASTGVRSETRLANNSGLARHAGLNAVNTDEFITLSQLNSRTATLSWMGSLNTQDPVQSFLSHRNNLNLFSVQDADTLFQLGGGVAANNLFFKVRKANAADPNQTVTCRVFINRSGTASYTQSIAFAGDTTLRFVCTASIANNSVIAVSFQPSGPVPNNVVVSMTAFATRSNI